MWREVRLEATEQAFGRTNRWAHAVPKGFCAHLINALKLLANQRKRKFIEVDNERALDVGSLSPGHENIFKYESRMCQKGAKR